MIPDDLRIGPFPIHVFGVVLAVAFVVAAWVVTRELRRRGLDPDLGSEVVLWAAIGGLVGARLWVVVEAWPAFLQSPWRYLLTGSGLAWYGGFLGGTLAVTLCFRRHAIPWWVGADVAAPAIALGHAIGRIGCQLAGDGDWGKETTLPWGMAYPHAVVGWDKPPGVRVHPTPLYECAAYLAVFALLTRIRRDDVPAGTVFCVYLVTAGLARFVIEFVRINPPVVAGLTEAQIASLLLVACGMFVLVRRRPAGRPISTPS